MNAASRRLTLKEAPETAQVKEAKDAARLVGVAGDHAATNWALRLIEARDAWGNRPRPGPGLVAYRPVVIRDRPIPRSSEWIGE